METTVKMVIMSHLSDIQCTRIADSEIINFIKFLILEFPDTKTQIDPDEEYDRFRQLYV